MRQNNVRGPTSALTEYLKSSGINARNIGRRPSTRTAQNQGDGDDDNADAGPSNSRENVEEDEDEAPTEGRRATRSSTNRRRASGYDSENLDEEENEEEETTGKKRKLSKAAEAKQKAKEKAKATAKEKAKKDDDEEEEDDPYNALSKSLWSGSGAAKPPVGSFADCAKCEKQFTVTKYTMAANPGPGFLCHPCAKASGTDPFKKPAAPRKKKRPTERRAVTFFEERKFPTLASMCIDIITKHIDDVEALGDIGTLNAEAISKALSKNRKLTAEHASLFYDVSNASLTFHDTTDLAPPALSALARLNPNLTYLRLDYCGQLDNSAFDTFTHSLPHLTHLILLGPFLIHSENWQRFFPKHPSLECFQIIQSPRFDLPCFKALVKHCGASLTDLRLKQVGKLDDACLKELTKLGKSQMLRMLDLSEPSTSCSEIAVVKLLGAIGRELRVLDLSKHDLLTDTFLEEGLGCHVTQLERLFLNHVVELTDDGVASFFAEWANPPLVEIDLSRNHELGSKALPSLLKHSGKALEVLNINGWKEVSEPALRGIAGYGRELRKLDVGWCRQLDNFVVKAWLDGDPDHDGWTGCPNLTELKIWGCNRITAACPKRKGLSIYGVESQEIII